MLGQTPLRKQHAAFMTHQAARRPVEADRPGAATGARAEADEVLYLPWGPDGDDQLSCEVPGAYGVIELEYAAIRRGAGLVDAPHRGTLMLTGSERVDFLNRMITQQVNDLKDGVVRESFIVNRKGRIEGDLLLVAAGDRVFIDLDLHQAESVRALLDGFLFSEDVELTDVSATWYRVSIHGQYAIEAVAAAAGSVFFALDELHAVTVSIGGHDVVVARRDQTGEPGLELFMPRDAVETVWAALIAADESVDHGRVRPVGWFAFNVARIEAGTVLANVDFAGSSLPHETGLTERRISFNKGCYPGQEIVARMQNLGGPKQQLVGLRIPGGQLPVAGAQVFADGDLGSPVGGVTSSTISPMLGSIPVAIAMVRSAHAAPGTKVAVNAEGETVEAIVSSMQFLESDAAPDADPDVDRTPDKANA